jgi:hypothetical protein
VGLYTDVERAIEVCGPGYTRIFVPFDVDDRGQLSNPTTARFPEATGSWGIVVGLGIHSSPTGPALLISRLDNEVNVLHATTTLDFLPRNLRLDGGFIPEVEIQKVFPEPRTVWERLSEPNQDDE